MPIPKGLGAIDLMISFPSADARGHYDNLRALAKDAESKEMEFPAEYMFKQVPNYLPEGADPVEITLQEMDFCGVAAGLVGNPYFEPGARALKEHPDRFFAGIEIDPNDITGAVRKIRKAKDDADIKAVTTFPAGCTPQVPVSDRRYYPIYQTCIDLDIPIISNAGIPGPRVPAACQDVMHFDEVCYDFPELRIIMRHGAEPWEALAVKLMLKWPGLYYMPSAFAPKYYPKAVIDYANSRGSDKVMYAGYYPMGLSLRRIFEEMPGVPLKDDADIKAVTTFPAGCTPQVPVSDRRYYPIYQTCIDLDIPIISNAGIPGPRVPAACQDVMHFDEVCYDFPELRIIMRHGAEPWEALAVKLMLKWPGLYYMPSAFAPKYYPKAIIDYANSRGSDKVMYAGYYPMGLSLRRIFEEMPGVPLKDQVWPKFLRNNAIDVLKLDLPKFTAAV